MTDPTTIFIIDDDPDDRELLIEAISEIDPSIVCDSSTGSLEALKTLSADPLMIPNYIFLDINMPLMNGKECLIEIKKIERLAVSTIVIYTTSQHVDDIREMLALGASFFLIKPSLFLHLKKAIQYILSNNDNREIEIEGLFR